MKPLYHPAISHITVEGIPYAFSDPVRVRMYAETERSECSRINSLLEITKGISMFEIIDLSQDIFPDMPVFPGLPEVKITIHQSHEQLDGITDSDVVSPAVHRLELGEHTGTHVDAINHMARQYRGQSIDTMPLTMFYAEGICLDLSHKGLRELIEITDLEHALSEASLEIKPGDTVLL